MIVSFVSNVSGFIIQTESYTFLERNGASSTRLTVLYNIFFVLPGCVSENITAFICGQASE